MLGMRATIHVFESGCGRERPQDQLRATGRVERWCECGNPADLHRDTGTLHASYERPRGSSHQRTDTSADEGPHTPADASATSVGGGARRGFLSASRSSYRGNGPCRVQPGLARDPKPSHRKLRWPGGNLEAPNLQVEKQATEDGTGTESRTRAGIPMRHTANPSPNDPPGGCLVCAAWSPSCGNSIVSTNVKNPV